jgi:hypothetical protein
MTVENPSALSVAKKRTRWADVALYGLDVTMRMNSCVVVARRVNCAHVEVASGVIGVDKLRRFGRRAIQGYGAPNIPAPPPAGNIALPD